MKSLNTVVRALKEGEALKRHEGVSHLRQDRQGRLHEGVGTVGTWRRAGARRTRGAAVPQRRPVWPKHSEQEEEGGEKGRAWTRRLREAWSRAWTSSIGHRKTRRLWARGWQEVENGLEWGPWLLGDTWESLGLSRAPLGHYLQIEILESAYWIKTLRKEGPKFCFQGTLSPSFQQWSRDWRLETTGLITANCQ